MLRALAGRFVFALLLVVVAYVAALLVTALAPGDHLDEEMRSVESIRLERQRLGLDEPVLTRILGQLSKAAQLDLGESTAFNRPVRALVVERTATTLQAGLSALGVALLLGIPAGVVASRTSSVVLRTAVTSLSVLLLSLPALVIALILSVAGTSVGLPPFVVMTVSLALPAAALLERLQARAMTAALSETCLRAAQARGVPGPFVTWRHAWPLSLPAVLGVASIVASHLLSGALAIELITSRAGLGLLTVQALMARDVNLAAGCAGMAGLLVGVVTLAGDTLQLAIDPRLRSEGSAAHDLQHLRARLSP